MVLGPMKTRFILAAALLFNCFCTHTLIPYEKPPKVSDKVWAEVSPYFLPEDDPASKTLMKILKKRRATLSPDSLKKSGFTSIQTQPYTKITTAKHPKLPSLFFKVYLDAQKPYKNKADYAHWLARIRGALLIQAMIEKNNWHDTFKVPRKWIFPLPASPAPPSLFEGVHFILVEEDMQILTKDHNLSAWKSPLVTPSLLDRLYLLITTLGLSDCLVPKNIPFSIDNKIAFIDTETTMSFPIRWGRFSSCLSPEMALYWDRIIREKN